MSSSDSTAFSFTSTKKNESTPSPMYSPPSPMAISSESEPMEDPLTVPNGSKTERNWKAEVEESEDVETKVEESEPEEEMEVEAKQKEEDRTHMSDSLQIVPNQVAGSEGSAPTKRARKESEENEDWMTRKLLKWMNDSAHSEFVVSEANVPFNLEELKHIILPTITSKLATIEARVNQPHHRLSGPLRRHIHDLTEGIRESAALDRISHTKHRHHEDDIQELMKRTENDRYRSYELQRRTEKDARKMIEMEERYERKIAELEKRLNEHERVFKLMKTVL